MAAPQNFRSAFNGFNREDVVNYISYITSKHETEVNELRSEIDNLSKDLDFVRSDSDIREELEEENADLKEQLEQLRGQLEQQKQQLDGRREETDALNRAAEEQKTRLADAEARCEQLQQELDQARTARPADSEKKPEQNPNWSEELNAYRRAESTERRARERVARMYDRANAALAETSTRLESSAGDLKALAEQVQQDLEVFERALGESGQMLAEAAVSLGAIRPEEG